MTRDCASRARVQGRAIFLPFSSARRVHVVLSCGGVVKGEQFDEYHEWGSGRYSLLLTVQP